MTSGHLILLAVSLRVIEKLAKFSEADKAEFHRDGVACVGGRAPAGESSCMGGGGRILRSALFVSYVRV